MSPLIHEPQCNDVTKLLMRRNDFDMQALCLDHSPFADRARESFAAATCSKYPLSLIPNLS
jgi:hypothetical protein